MSYKSITKLITLVFAVLIIVQTFGFLLYSISGQYATAIDFEPNISIPGMSALFQQGSKPGSLLIDGSSIGNYVKTIYNYAIGSVGILSTVVMAFGGILWITAAGNTSRVDKAKATIAASLTGLVLTFSSYLILNMINPDLLRFEPLDIRPIEKTDPPETQIIGDIIVDPSAQESCGPNTPTQSIEHNCVLLCNSKDLTSVGARQEGEMICCTCQSECFGQKAGASCFNTQGSGSCYNNVCETEPGTEGQPCGNEINAQCFKRLNAESSICPEGYSWDAYGGRSCTSGNYCCHPSN